MVAPTRAISGTQSGSAASDFSGTWQPTNPKADLLFAAGVSDIPSDGRLIIVQRPRRRLSCRGVFRPGKAHQSDPVERSNSYRIAPEAAMGVASWKKGCALIQHADSRARNWKNVTSALTLVGGDLQIDKTWQLRLRDDARPGAFTFRYRRTPLWSERGRRIRWPICALTLPPLPTHQLSERRRQTPAAAKYALTPLFCLEQTLTGDQQIGQRNHANEDAGVALHHWQSRHAFRRHPLHDNPQRLIVSASRWMPCAPGCYRLRVAPMLPV